MHLIDVKITGFRRFENTGVNLDGRVIAIVGPNESGKSSLLDLLSALENEKSFERSDITRGKTLSPHDTVVEARYLLNEDDRALVMNLGGVGEPRWYVLGKRANGSLYHHVEPGVSRDNTARSQAKERLERALANKRLRSSFSVAYPIGRTEPEEAPNNIPLNERLEHIKVGIETKDEDLSEGILEEIKEVLHSLNYCQEEVAPSNKRSVELVSEKLARLIEVEEREHPEDLLLEELNNRRPQFFFFNDEDRQLSSEYPVDALADPPSALSNLLTLAQLNIPELRAALSREDHGKRASLEESANLKLKEQFNSAWGQSDVFVHLKLDPEVIHILVRATDTYSPIAERSDGLRAFVALYAFTHLQSDAARTILLIDEAEAHLHYDAQADLIRVFESQKEAAQIIYTTHSAGCLPNDLGTGIRAISPIHLTEGQDTNRSVINNSFWTEGPGFSPLLLAMGASVLALVPTRLAVIAEGPSDAIILPTLFREVTKLGKLDFQVAPGLASVSKDQAKDLDLEAPRVAYLVDGDTAGSANRKKLLKAGISENEIAQLPNDLVVEDLLDVDVYLLAINEELHRSHGDTHQLEKSAIPDCGRPTAIERWCKDRKIPPPKKVKVAIHVIAQSENKKLVAPNLRQHIASIFEEVSRILEPG